MTREGTQKIESSPTGRIQKESKGSLSMYTSNGPPGDVSKGVHLRDCNTWVYPELQPTFGGTLRIFALLMDRRARNKGHRYEALSPKRAKRGADIIPNLEGHPKL